MVMETDMSNLAVTEKSLSTPPLQSRRSLASILISGNRTHRKKPRNVTFSFDLEYEKSKNKRTYNNLRPSLKRKLSDVTNGKEDICSGEDLSAYGQNMSGKCRKCMKDYRKAKDENLINKDVCSCDVALTSNGESKCTNSSSPTSSITCDKAVRFSSTSPSLSRSIFPKNPPEIPFDFNRNQSNGNSSSSDLEHSKKENMTKVVSKCAKTTLPSILNSPHSRSGSILEHLKGTQKSLSPNVATLSPSLLLGKIITEINSTKVASSHGNQSTDAEMEKAQESSAEAVQLNGKHLNTSSFIDGVSASTTTDNESQKNYSSNQSKSIQTSLSKYFKMANQNPAKSGSITGYKESRISLPSELNSIGKTNSSLSPLSAKKNYANGQTYVKTRMQKSKQSRLLSSSPTNTSKEQLCIDAGQRDIGHVICPGCGMVYTKSQVDDEAHHAKFHHKLINKLRFGGWKSEKVLDVYHDGRVIVISNEDHHLHVKKVNEVRDVVDTELGFASPKNRNSDEMTFLFISNRKVIGCVIAVPINKAYPVILSDSNVQSSEAKSPVLSWCCSTDPVQALCGINRMWVFNQARRQNIATRLVDCVRNHFMYGCVIAKDKIAFSDPTPSGRAFAEKYCETKKILVFR